MKNQKAVPTGRQGFTPIIIILIVLLGIGGVYYFFSSKLISPAIPTDLPQVSISPTSTPDPTANWKMYTNTKYNFSFKYPPNYEISLENDLAIWIFDKVSNKTISIGLNSPSSDPDPKDADTTFYGFVSRVALQNCASNDVATGQETYCDKVLSQSKIGNVHNLTGYKLFLNMIGGNPNKKKVGPVLSLDVSSYSNNQLRSVELLYIPIERSTPSDELVLDQILSTFKFLENGQTACTYNGTDYKIGDTFKALDGCNICTCEGSQISCTEMACGLY